MSKQQCGRCDKFSNDLRCIMLLESQNLSIRCEHVRSITRKRLCPDCFLDMLAALNVWEHALEPKGAE